MAIDEQKSIIVQSLIKSITSCIPPIEEDNKFIQKVKVRLDALLKMAVEHSTIAADEEFINTGVRVPKAYWDARNEELIGSGNRPQKTEKGWFIFAKMKNITEFKKFIEERENQENG